MQNTKQFLLSNEVRKPEFITRIKKIYINRTPSAGLKCRSQVTGQVTGYRPQATGQVTGHRSDHRSGHRSQATGHRSGHRSHKNNRTLDKTVLD